MSQKIWGEGAVKLSQTKAGFAIAIYRDGKREYVENGDYVVNWFDSPMKFKKEQFEFLFEDLHGPTKIRSKNTK